MSLPRISLLVSRPILPTLVSWGRAAIAVGWAPLLFSQTPILSFPESENLWGNVGPIPADTSASGVLGAGESAVRLHALFGAAHARNPSVSFPNLPWETPAFFGGYLLLTYNGSGGDYFPNFLRTISSPEEGRGYLSFSLTRFVGPDESGDVTNSVFGALVTDTAISGEGEFRALIRENSFGFDDGASVMIRGAAYDGSRWLVTKNSAVVPTSGVDHAMVSTRGGWLEMDTADFTYGEDTTSPSGPITQSGIWFLASEKASGDDVGFVFNLSDAYFTARGAVENYTADTSGDGAVSLAELLRIIELYNTRLSSTRTGRYTPSETSADGFSPDSVSLSGTLALYARYHGSDIDRDGSISLAELLRVIEIYNTRTGTTRTGKYRLDPTTDDGVAPDSGD